MVPMHSMLAVDFESQDRADDSDIKIYSSYMTSREESSCNTKMVVIMEMRVVYSYELEYTGARLQLRSLVDIRPFSS